MKTSPFAFLALFLAAFSAEPARAASWHGRIFDVKGGQLEIGSAALAGRLARARNVVLGEKHDTPAVQAAQAEIMESVIGEAGRRDDFTLAWEFLNVSGQRVTEEAFSRFVAGEIGVAELLSRIQGHEGYLNYSPVLEATKRLGGRLIGVNLTRAEKAPVTRGGIGAADPALVPPGFALGSGGYRERFTETMREHVPPEKIENYFAAQCLTDDVIAFHLLQDSASPLNFLVIGSFHTDYFDGTVERLKLRAPDQLTLTVKLVDASDYAEGELLSLLTDARYGEIADYVYFVNEPSSEASRRRD
ncbi:MAG: ChaN family lipoprotein [Oligoflexia bacterium]|nr:ChaN family lipoprotein [Oligoflexia bacterium]